MTAGFSHHGWIWILGLAALLAFALYRRGRRMIGHQRYMENRIRLRIGVIAILTVVAVIPLVQRGHAAVELGSAAAGFAAGIVIAVAALRFTQMGRDGNGLWYVPNVYLGVGLIALLVARFGYEYFVVFPQIRIAAAAAVHGAPPPPVPAQPMLHGMLFLVLGYYIVYYSGIIVRARRMPEGTAATADGSGS